MKIWIFETDTDPHSGQIDFRDTELYATRELAMKALADFAAELNLDLDDEEYYIEDIEQGVFGMVYSKELIES